MSCFTNTHRSRGQPSSGIYLLQNTSSSLPDGKAVFMAMCRMELSEHDQGFQVFLGDLSPRANSANEHSKDVVMFEAVKTHLTTSQQVST